MTGQDFNAAMGSVIRQFRKAKGLSQGAVAKVIGVSYQQVSKIEAGTNGVPAEAMPKYAESLGTSVAELFYQAGVRNAYRPGEAA